MENLKKEELSEMIKNTKADIFSIHIRLEGKNRLLSELNKAMITLNVNLFKSEYGVHFRSVIDEYIKFVKNNSLKWPYGEDDVGHSILMPTRRSGGGMTHMIDPKNYTKCIPDKKIWDAFGVLGRPLILSTKPMKFDKSCILSNPEEVFDFNEDQ